MGRNADEAARISAIARCDVLIREADVATTENQFTIAKGQLDSASTVCVGTQVEKLAAVRANLDKVEAAHNERVAQENAKRRAQTEREAAEKRQRDFNTAIDDAARVLKQAKDEAARAKWADADAHVEAASR